MKELIKKLGNKKGISLITLSVAVTILIIITGTLLYNARDTIEVRNLKNMYNDIELLEDKVEAYYLEYGGIPAILEYNINENTDLLAYISELKNNKNFIDGDIYYLIDIESLEGITTLNYGRDYKNRENDDFSSSSYDDIYIINQVSHQIYYVRGVESDGNKYYTNELKTKDVDMKITVIDSIEDLVRFEQKVNGTYKENINADYEEAKTFEGEYVVLTRNLDFEDNNSYDGTTVIINDTTYCLNGTNDLKTYLCVGGTGCTPIGNYSSDTTLAFNGTFKGNDYSIDNIYINNSSSYQGLFGINYGIIQNITVSGNITGSRIVAGISGSNYGTIQYCINKCSITSSESSNVSQSGGIAGRNYNKIYRCKNEGSVTATKGQVGGISGFNANNSTAEECANTGVVTSEKDYVGGIIGLNGYAPSSYSGTIINCYNTGSVEGKNYVGGIAGTNVYQSTISYSYNIGSISGTGTYVGAICGQKGDSSTLGNCYYLEGSSTYGIGSTSSDDNAVSKTTSELQTKSTFVNWDFTTPIWKIVSGINNGYLILSWQ